ncbi:uncharacterized protein LOC119078790 [Bradysia coprophila]|uniref:uncharacterized protein LOC119078790 n=1 Tax=Bradysia coprophila TaxID=38358 RepID=UPI00187DC6A1|nr:uncharacterized protein LOC119078790 [Bradysia coprophila]
MSAVEDQQFEHEEEDISDVMLYLIKDDLPRAVVHDLYDEIEKIHGVKNIVDFGAFIQIEFASKTDANVARADGFKYKLNDQEQRRTFATACRVANYSRQLCPPHVGVGF